MSYIQTLENKIRDHFIHKLNNVIVANNEITLEVAPEHLRDVSLVLRDHDEFQFNLLVDIAGVDYLEYGCSEWVTDKATGLGFERGVSQDKEKVLAWDKPRFAVVYHLLSVTLNHRIRLKVFLNEDNLIVDSVCDIWSAANWYEREAFDLYGILFNDHPDLRRILTDYGFIGHPFRKDFPLSGYVEVRYDAQEQRVIYQPVEMDIRVLVPKVIRDDNRYLIEEESRHV